MLVFAKVSCFFALRLQIWNRAIKVWWDPNIFLVLCTSRTVFISYYLKQLAWTRTLSDIASSHGTVSPWTLQINWQNVTQGIVLGPKCNPREHGTILSLEKVKENSPKHTVSTYLVLSCVIFWKAQHGWMCQDEVFNLIS